MKALRVALSISAIGRSLFVASKVREYLYGLTNSSASTKTMNLAPQRINWLFGEFQEYGFGILVDGTITLLSGDGRTVESCRPSVSRSGQNPVGSPVN